jgi:hypothetical protein
VRQGVAMPLDFNPWIEELRFHVRTGNASASCRN